MKKGKPQAKDIDDVDFLRAVIACGGTGPYNWAMRWDVAAKLPAFPAKVVQAKARALLKSGLLGGCGCGCRGDYHVTDAGKAFLSVVDEVAARLRQELQQSLVPDPGQPLPDFKGRLAEVVDDAYERIERGELPSKILPPHGSTGVLLETDKPGMLRLYITDGVKH